MDFISILLIAVGVSADCFAVALFGGAAARNPALPQALRISATFGLAQSVMTFGGWLAGRVVVEFISGYDHWVAFGLLAIIGSRMIHESFEKEDRRKIDITRGLALLVLAIATSIDALAVGLSFGLLTINIGLAVATIGTVAMVITGVGFYGGGRFGHLLANRAELVGGIVLIGIGVRIIVEHLLE